jgi:polar amino acid transport system permease protein
LGYTIHFSEIFPYFPLLLQGLALSIVITVTSTLIGTGLGLASAVATLSRWPPARRLAGCYVEAFRNTPLLVQMYLIYFGLGQFEIHIPPITAAIVAMTVNTGAYTSVIFQAGIQAVDISQKEGALALGLTGAQTFRRVILPQAFRIVFAPLVNQAISLFLFSAVASTIAVPELTHQAMFVDSVTWRTFEVLIVASALYFACTSVVGILADLYERRRPVRA